MGTPTRSLAWQLGMSAYWFATSMKWYIVFLTLSFVVDAVVPGGETGRYWGAVFGIGAAWAVFGPGLFGYLSGRLRGRIGSWRPWLAVGSGLTVVALVILGDAEQYFVVVLGYLLLQVSDDMATGPYSAIVPALVPVEQRGRVSGVMSLVQLLAQLVGGIIAIQLGDLKTIYLTLAGINVFFASITLLTVREEITDETASKEPFFKAWAEPWKVADFRWAWITRFLNALGFYLLITYLPLFLRDVVQTFEAFGIVVAQTDADTTLEEAARRAALTVGLTVSFIGAIGAVIGGRLADKIGRRKVIYMAAGWMALIIIPAIFIQTFPVVAILGLCFGLGYGAYESASWALASDVLPSRADSAKDMGIWQSSIAAPQIVAGFAFGWVVDLGNRIQMGYGYSFTFAGAVVAYVASAVWVKSIRGSS